MMQLPSPAGTHHRAGAPNAKMTTVTATTRPDPQPCAHCGRPCGDTAGGCGSINGTMVCHPNQPGRPDCYHLATTYGLTHPLHNCPRCTPPDAMSPEISRALATICGSMGLTPANRELLAAQVPPDAKIVADLPEHIRFLWEKAQGQP